MKTLLSRSLVVCSTATLLFGTVGCAGLLPKPPVAPTYYTLDEIPRADGATLQRLPAATASRPTLAVNVPRAAAGYDSTRIVYAREPQRLDSYANSVWIDTPAKMLTPMMVAAIESSGAFAAVVSTPSAARADIELDTQIVRLQHDFSGTPSRVRFTLRASLIDSITRRVLVSREFDSVVSSPSEDARGGVVAAQAAVGGVMAQLATLCSDAETRWKAAHNDMQAERKRVRP